MAQYKSGTSKLAIGAAVAIIALPIAYFSAVAEDGDAQTSGGNFVQSLFSGTAEMINPNDFVRMKDFDGHLEVADYVDTQAISRAKITKIGYGRTAEINIVTTSTGTYSSDGLRSAHISYPGVKLVPSEPKTSWRHGYWRKFRGVMVHTQNGYFSIPQNGAPSYWLLYRTGPQTLVSMEHDRVCAHTSNATICN